jgi:hypothetical protein
MIKQETTMVSKSVFSSVTFWGSVTALVAALAPGVFVKLGYDAPTVASYIVSAIGFGVTVYGRITATQAVTLTGGTPAAPLAGK